MKVNFMIIGAARSATTSLSTILATHPSISFSKPKEPQFFSKEDWRTSINTYQKLFKQKDNVLYGEGSTNYTKHPSFNKNIYTDIFEYNSEMKLIYIIRNPLDRIKSHYKFALERGYTKEAFNKAVISNPIYVNTSKYYTQIQPYINTFGRTQVKIILFEEFSSNTQKTVTEICGFLNIGPINLDSKKTHFNQSMKGEIGSVKYDNPKNILDYIKKITNYIKRSFSDKGVSKVIEQPSEDTLLYLRKNLNEDIVNLENLISKDLSHWKI